MEYCGIGSGGGLKGILYLSGIAGYWIGNLG